MPIHSQNATGPDALLVHARTCVCASVRLCVCVSVCLCVCVCAYVCGRMCLQRCDIIAELQLQCPMAFFFIAIPSGMFVFGIRFHRHRCGHRHPSLSTATIAVAVTIGISIISIINYCYE